MHFYKIYLSYYFSSNITTTTTTYNYFIWKYFLHMYYLCFILDYLLWYVLNLYKITKYTKSIILKHF